MKKYSVFFLSVLFFVSGFFALSGRNVAAQWEDPKIGKVATESGLPAGLVPNLAKNLMFWSLALVGFLAIIGFVVAGILYLTAAGNDGQLKKAKTAMTWSMVGVTVALVGYVVILAVKTWLSGDEGYVF